MKILVINGPNMNMLGVREPKLYGSETYDDLVRYIEGEAGQRGIDVSFFQSNHEGEIIDRIQQALEEAEGIIINPAAFTHTSIAIADAIRATGIPAVEVHITDVSGREDYRQVSYVREACVDVIAGEGFVGYARALDILAERYSDEKRN